ncbi:hypothetical protein Pcinc_030742 [Petrolisthes cinctipes]|uniref:Uncharacterized protein n=1 Tax=Petrolisthes cinctipes TaxID=88211 RepID=A0AAE1EY48_PETCI|nr:hypothetical protein Pcinc_030742 [Petrolisthes cinctipes]
MVKWSAPEFNCSPLGFNTSPRGSPLTACPPALCLCITLPPPSHRLPLGSLPASSLTAYLSRRSLPPPSHPTLASFPSSLPIPLVSLPASFLTYLLLSCTSLPPPSPIYSSRVPPCLLPHLSTPLVSLPASTLTYLPTPFVFLTPAACLLSVCVSPCLLPLLPSSTSLCCLPDLMLLSLTHSTPPFFLTSHFLPLSPFLFRLVHLFVQSNKILLCSSWSLLIKLL